MRTAFIHFLRYLGWALAGAVLFVSLLYFADRANDYAIYGPAPELWAPVALVGAVALVLVRAGVGAVSRVEASRADRITAVGLGRVALGAAVGLFAAHRSFWEMMPDRLLLRLCDRGWWHLPLMLSGALAAVATGWLVWRRCGSILLPVSWTLVFALLITGWLALSKEMLHQRVRLRLARGAPLKLRLPHRLEQPLEFRTGLQAHRDQILAG
jgi:hypothetical protein